MRLHTSAYAVLLSLCVACATAPNLQIHRAHAAFHDDFANRWTREKLRCDPCGVFESGDSRSRHYFYNEAPAFTLLPHDIANVSLVKSPLVTSPILIAELSPQGANRLSSFMESTPNLEFIVFVHGRPVGVGFPLRTAIGIGQESEISAEALARQLGFAPYWEHVEKSEIETYLGSLGGTAGQLE